MDAEQKRQARLARMRKNAERVSVGEQSLEEAKKNSSAEDVTVGPVSSPATVAGLGEELPRNPVEKVVPADGQDAQKNSAPAFATGDGNLLGKPEAILSKTELDQKRESQPWYKDLEDAKNEEDRLQKEYDDKVKEDESYRRQEDARQRVAAIGDGIASIANLLGTGGAFNKGGVGSYSANMSTVSEPLRQQIYADRKLRSADMKEISSRLTAARNLLLKTQLGYQSQAYKQDELEAKKKNWESIQKRREAASDIAYRKLEQAATDSQLRDKREWAKIDNTRNYQQGSLAAREQSNAISQQRADDYGRNVDSVINNRDNKPKKDQSTKFVNNEESYRDMVSNIAKNVFDVDDFSKADAGKDKELYAIISSAQTGNKEAKKRLVEKVKSDPRMKSWAEQNGLLEPSSPSAPASSTQSNGGVNPDDILGGGKDKSPNKSPDAILG